MTTTADPNELLTLPQAADYLGVSEQTIRRWTLGGLLPRRMVGSFYVYRVEDLDERKQYMGRTKGES